VWRGWERTGSSDSSLRLREFHQTKIENLHAAVCRDKDVLGFQVAMHDALLVCGRKTMRDLNSVLHGFANRKGPATQSLAQRFPFQQFGNDIGRRLVLAEVVHGQDIRMIQRGGGACFLLEALEAFWVR
jgi:hypothetical protein